MIDIYGHTYWGLHYVMLYGAGVGLITGMFGYYMGIKRAKKSSLK